MADSPDVVMQRLHDDHAGALWGHCLRLTNHDRARAEDVCQETLLRAWRNASLLDESQGSVRAWLFTVARNIVIDEWRSRRHRSELPVAEVPERDDPDDRTVIEYQTDAPGGVYLRMASLPQLSAAGWGNVQIQLNSGTTLTQIPGVSTEPGRRRTTTIRVLDFGSQYLPMPYAPHLEDAALPQPADIVAVARALVRGK